MQNSIISHCHHEIEMIQLEMKDLNENSFSK